MTSDEATGDDVYQPDGETDEVREDEGILDPEDTLTDRGADPYDEGWSPPERPLAVDHYGTTAAEQAEGESLDQRLAEEVSDPALSTPTAEEESGDGIGDVAGTDGEPLSESEAGDARAGRLVAPDDGASGDPEDDAKRDMRDVSRQQDVFAQDAGIDGAAAGAEEAAVHVVPNPDELDERQP